MEVLTAYVRENAKRPTDDTESQPPRPGGPRTDVMAALVAIYRRVPPVAESERGRLDLSRADLRGFTLPRVLRAAPWSVPDERWRGLSRADLSRADLTGANLSAVLINERTIGIDSTRHEDSATPTESGS